MDFATIFGLILGIICIAFGMIGGRDHSVLRLFLDLPSVFITIGGAVAATIMSYPLSTLAKVGGALKVAFFAKDIDMNGDMDTIVELANVARRDGLLALEDYVVNIEDPFLKKGMMLMADGSDRELIRSVLETEIDNIESRHAMGSDLFMTLSSFGPAFGMIGTLIGLILMLDNLDEPTGLGPGMATALVTTLYGALLANLVATPIGKKLRVRSAQEVLEKEMLLEGLLAIQDGENPRIIRDRLSSFVSRKYIAKGAPGRRGTAGA